jgi:hypothetical protein
VQREPIARGKAHGLEPLERHSRKTRALEEERPHRARRYVIEHDLGTRGVVFVADGAERPIVVGADEAEIATRYCCIAAIISAVLSLSGIQRRRSATQSSPFRVSKAILMPWHAAFDHG